MFIVSICIVRLNLPFCDQTTDTADVKTGVKS